MKLHLEAVTDENRMEVQRLETAPSQRGYVESVEECLEEADCRKCWRPVAVYDGDLLIGFAMYGFFWQYFPFGRVWLDRLMIDRRYQGRGYGTEILSILLERLYREYRRRKIYLSVVDGNDAAVHIYRKAGFSFNGELDIHGEKVMVYQFDKKKREKLNGTLG